MDTDDGITSKPPENTKPTITESAKEETVTTSEPPVTDSAPSTSQKETAIPPTTATDSEETTIRFKKPFLAAHTAYTKSRPHPEQDLIDTYGLTWLARTVARTDPVTGEKINKIRKSYEGQIKAFGLAGRNKAIKWDPSQGHSISQLAQAPAEDYHNSRVAGKEVSKGLSSASQSRLQKVFELTPGPVSRNAEWENALGIDKTKGVADDVKVKKQEVPREAPQVNPKANGHVNGTTSSKDADLIRPKRINKKRRYNDESFEGYGDGYDDEDDGSSDDGSRRSVSSKHKRQKVGYP